MKAINTSLTGLVQSGGTAYFRLDPAFRQFLEQCEEKHGIIGYEWDQEDPWTFGVILKK